MRYSIIFSAVALITSVYADKPAEVPGMKVVWSDDFSGAEGPFDKTKWQYYDGDIYNQEEQKYPKSGDYCKLSGEGSLLITPSKDKNGQWQSCRIESIKAFAPPPGGKVMFASKFRLGAPGSTGNMKGIWPAVWTLGESKRTGTIWPACGEIDTFENVSGDNIGHGTVHCAEKCNSPTGNGHGIDFNRGEWVTFAHVVGPDSIEFLRNGQTYHVVQKSDLSANDWKVLGEQAFFITLNVATGGGWPGATAPDTVQGKAASMELKYSAVYHSV